MEMTIQHLGDAKFQASTRGHRLICDQPLASGGSDAGMTPPELLLAALGTCAGYYAVQYLKARSLPVGGLEVKVNAEKAFGPSRLGRFAVEVTAPEAPPEHHAGLLRAVQACLIHRTLEHTPATEIAVRTAVEATV
jgi:putative redox protein